MPGRASRAPRAGLLLLLVLIAVLATYARSLEGGFVWDDRQLIENAPLVERLHPISEYFTSPFWQSREQGADVRAYYRPLVTLSYAIDRAVHGPNPAGFHLTNVLIHLVNVALVFALCRRAGAGPVAASVAATAWGVAPRLAETVAWISGRTDALASTFCLAAIWVWPRKVGGWLAASFIALGFLSKELAVAAIAALAVDAWTDRERGRRAAFARLAPSIAVAVVYAIVRSRVLANPTVSQLDSTGRVLVVLEALGRYPSMVVDAWRPRTQIGFTGHPDVVLGVLGLVFAIALTLSIRRGRARITRPIAVALVLAATSTALVLHVYPIPIAVIAADRFLYLPLAGLAIAVAPGLDRMLEKSRLALAVAFAAVLSLAAVGFARSAVWGDEVALWTDAVETSHPQNPLPAIELGNLHYRVGSYEAALEYYRRAANVDPGRARIDKVIVISNIGSSLSALGRHAEAIRTLERATETRPDVPKFWLDLGLARLHALDFAGARADVARALAVLPDYAQARDAASLVEKLETEAKSLPPRDRVDADALRARARFFGRAGRADDASREWLALLGRPEASASDADEALELIVRFGKLEDALTALERRRALGGDAPGPVLDALAYRADVVRRLRK